MEFRFRMRSWITKTSCLFYLPQPSDSADNTDLGFDNSWYHAQPHPIIVYGHQSRCKKFITLNNYSNLIQLGMIKWLVIHYHAFLLSYHRSKQASVILWPCTVLTPYLTTATTLRTWKLLNFSTVTSVTSCLLFSPNCKRRTSNEKKTVTWPIRISSQGGCLMVFRPSSSIVRYEGSLHALWVVSKWSEKRRISVREHQCVLT